ncbi:MAG: DUF2851 family protein [Bacteroidales bacterium]|nr:DUF2851 family protein [Bacteroidales bacterium]MBN2764616.1 DUF2851 family protein [Bacteroidales bacterium]
MTEEFLVYLWKYGLFDRTSLISDTGEAIEVISLGEHNTNAGPDFINAKIRINKTLWAGNVEIHVNASDWKKHHHQYNKFYDNVILHVVLVADQKVTRTNGTAVPTVELKFDQQFFSNYSYLAENRSWISCYNHIAEIDKTLLNTWLTSLMVERLESKTKRIDDLLRQYQNNWEEVFYVDLARSFGFHLNAVPFEQVARFLPLHILARHKDRLFQLEALLFGQAGFLGDGSADEYQLRLSKEYEHYKHKYFLKPVDQHLWKFMRLRPVNFPTVRLAQFAALFNACSGLFRKIIEIQNLQELTDLFSVRPSTYWDRHYKFGSVSSVRVKTLGAEASRTILINTAIPFIFLYGCKKGDESLKARAIDFLSRLPPEKNAIIARWGKAGLKAGSALDSQALLQLRSAYCQKKQCLRCMVGSRIILGTKDKG